MRDIRLKIASRKSLYAYGEMITLSYSARNLSQEDAFVVVNRSYKRVEGGKVLVVTIAEVASPDVYYFQYNSPELRQLASGQGLRSQVTIGMPPTEPIIGTSGLVEVVELSLAGDIQIVVELGYLEAPFLPNTADPLEEFLAAQQTLASNVIDVFIEGV